MQTKYVIRTKNGLMKHARSERKGEAIIFCSHFEADRYAHGLTWFYGPPDYTIEEL